MDFFNFKSNYSTSFEDFRKAFETSKHLIVLTGAGVSAESGIPTFRGEGGLWKTFKAQDLATPEAFEKDPCLVWEFYQYRREVVLSKKPNPSHYALVECEKRFLEAGKKFTLITQNIDGFHKDVGTKNLIEMHGNLFKTRCTKCSNVEENRTPVIFKKNPKEGADNNDNLPKCKKCDGLLRPHVVWFNESLDPDVSKQIGEELDNCDFFVIAGTSGTVFPAASYSLAVGFRGVPIAEFNIDENPPSLSTSFYFRGNSGDLLPKYLLGEENIHFYDKSNQHLIKMLENASISKKTNQTASEQKLNTASNIKTNKVIPPTTNKIKPLSTKSTATQRNRSPTKKLSTAPNNTAKLNQNKSPTRSKSPLKQTSKTLSKANESQQTTKSTHNKPK